VTLAAMRAPGVSFLGSDIQCSKINRGRVENALCRSIRGTANGPDDVRTVFLRTTGNMKDTWTISCGVARPQSWSCRTTSARTH
jgi:hypothetical protein